VHTVIVHNHAVVLYFQKVLRTKWKKIFLSHSAIEILHDAFWWTFIDKFEVFAFFLVSTRSHCWLYILSRMQNVIIVVDSL